MEKCRKIGIAGIPAPEAGRRWKTRILADGLMPLLAISLVTILLAFMASAALASGVDYQYAQVTTPKGPLNMRKTASSKASIIEKIPNDTILAVSVVDDIWCKCTYHGKEGYVMTKYLSIMDISQFRSLSLYDSGQDVSLLKEKLQELYYFDTEADISDSYDSDTEATVKLFQAANGMEETGIASPELQAFVYWGDPKNNLPTKPMTVEISSRCSGYNHVGQNWSRYSSINGESISSGDVLDIVLDESITIYSKITEKDSSPDVGSAKEDVEITQDYYDNGFTITQKVSVREDSGRYSGNKAVWTITYTFTPR